MANLHIPAPVVSPEWLAKNLAHPNLLVWDASIFTDASYTQQIRGAQFFDLDGAMSDPHTDIPHTMPSQEQFQREARALGLSQDSVVVVYDFKGIFSAPRAWWMLHSMGFSNVAVLDGGLPVWLEKGFPVEPLAVDNSRAQGDFIAHFDPTYFVNASHVLESLKDARVAVLDARSGRRFAGVEPEPREGLRAGHMPGALNLPFSQVQRKNRLLSAEDLRTVFAQKLGERTEMVASCGSGVSACVLALAATVAGYSDIAIYDGSWSEWGRPGELPVEQ